MSGSTPSASTESSTDETPAKDAPKGDGDAAATKAAAADATKETTPPEASPPATPTASDKAATDTVPYDRFKDVNERLQVFEEEKKQRDIAVAEKKEKELADSDDLAAKANTYRQQRDEYKLEADKVGIMEEALKSQLVEQRKNVPKHILLLLDKMNPAEQLSYLAANRSKILPPAKTTTNISATGGGKTPNGADLDKEQLARDYGV